MHRSTSLAAITLIGLSTLAATSVTAPAAYAASLPACTDYSHIHVPASTYSLLEPTLGRETGNTSCVVRYGNVSAAVAVLQRTYVNCYRSRVTVDGHFGPYTLGVTENVQKIVGLTPDGVVGPATRNRMNWSGTREDGAPVCEQTSAFS